MTTDLSWPKYAEIHPGRTGRILVYDRDVYEYASPAAFLRAETSTRWIVKNLLSGWLSGSSRYDYRASHLYGAALPLHQRVGNKYFADASIWKIGSADQWFEVIRALDGRYSPAMSPGSMMGRTFVSRFPSWDPKCPLSIKKLLHEGDPGALTQCYRYGVFPRRTVIDENSAYAAKLDPCPSTFVHKAKRRRPGLLYFCTADVKVPNTEHPFLGIRDSGRVFYPTGSFRVTCTESELDALHEIGGQCRVIDWYGFSQSPDPGQFARDVYADLSRSSSFPRKVLKAGLVAWIGKFSSTGSRSVRLQGGNTYVSRSGARRSSYQPQVSAWVHGRQRARLAGLLDRHGGIFADTDAIAPIDTSGLFNLIGSELGEWKIENEGDLAILGARAYWLNGAKLAGYPLSVKSPLEFLEATSRALDSSIDIGLYGINSQPYTYGFAATDRATLDDGYTRPWRWSEIADRIPYTSARDSQRKRLLAVQSSLSSISCD